MSVPNNKMEKTINGMSKKEIMELLSEPFSAEDKEMNTGFVTVNVQKYIDRLDDVIGCLNYSIITKESKFSNTAIFRTVEIIIYYDDGTEAVRKTGDGGAMFIYPYIKNEEGKQVPSKSPKQPENTNDTATSDAIKRACKKLRIGLDVYRENRLLAGKENLGKMVTGKVEEYRFTFQNKLHQDGNINNALYADVITDKGLRASLIIWKEQAAKLDPELLKELLDRSEKKGKGRVLGVFRLYGKKQYPQIVFEEVPR